MVFGASGRGGGAKARLFLPVAVLVLALAVSWAATPAGTDKAKSAEGNPAGLTLGDLLAGTYREVQRYAESAMGIGVVRSAVEVPARCNTSCLLLFSATFCFSRWV